MTLTIMMVFSNATVYKLILNNVHDQYYTIRHSGLYSNATSINLINTIKTLHFLTDSLVSVMIISSSSS